MRAGTACGNYISYCMSITIICYCRLRHGKYLLIGNVRFAYGHEQVLAAVGGLGRVGMTRMNTIHKERIRKP